MRHTGFGGVGLWKEWRLDSPPPGRRRVPRRHRDADKKSSVEEDISGFPGPVASPRPARFRGCARKSTVADWRRSLPKGDSHLFGIVLG
jgi:hypothetical protein